MSHNLYAWRVRIKAVEREYQTARVGLDSLEQATADEIHELTYERGWDDLIATEIYETERHLDATYVIRLFSVFERAVGSFWRQIPGNAGRKVDVEIKLRDVGYSQSIDPAVIDSAQAVRSHRNRLVHQQIENHAEAMTLEAASRDLLTYLNQLPATWG